MQINIINSVIDATYGYRKECFDSNGKQNTFIVRQKGLSILHCEYHLNSPAELTFCFDYPTLVFCLAHPIQLQFNDGTELFFAANEMVTMVNTGALGKIRLQKFQRYSLMFITGQIKNISGQDINSLILQLLKKSGNNGKAEYSEQAKLNDTELSLIQKLIETETSDAGNTLVLLHAKELYRIVLAALKKAPAHATNREIIKKAKTYIQDNLHQCHDISEYLKESGLTDRNLLTLFRSENGVTATEFTQQARLNKILPLLANTKMMVKFIGKTVGFKNPQVFNAFFMERMNQTPLEYRKSVAGHSISSV